ncbi:MAG: histidine phosphatase family protein [Actinomycetota bacterium]|nr:histidine phosphatase family protein [Actinomycetota bacterium]
MKRLVIVRHGATEWSVDGRHTGRTDIPLSPEGEAAARTLGHRLRQLGLSPVRVLSSPRQRAVNTARLAGLGDDLETTDRLQELDYGDYEGRKTVDIRRERPSWDLFRDGCPNGETLGAAGQRADALLSELAPEDGSGDVALFGHGHFSRILGARYIGLPAPDARYLALSTACICILGHEHEWRAIHLWNDAPR